MIGWLLFSRLVQDMCRELRSASSSTWALLQSQAGRIQSGQLGQSVTVPK